MVSSVTATAQGSWTMCCVSFQTLSGVERCSRLAQSLQHMFNGRGHIPLRQTNLIGIHDFWMWIKAVRTDNQSIKCSERSSQISTGVWVSLTSLNSSNMTLKLEMVESLSKLAGYKSVSTSTMYHYYHHHSILLLQSPPRFTPLVSSE